MSIFASRTQKTIDLPFDPPHTITIQKLAGRHLGKAREAWLEDLYTGVRNRGGASAQKEMQALFQDRDEGKGDKKSEAAEAIEKVQADPLNGLDKFTVVRFGVKAWSYDLLVSPESIDDMDDQAVDFIATEIMRLTKPALFQTKTETEAAQKNG
jgi:hypothetical protein